MPEKPETAPDGSSSLPAVSVIIPAYNVAGFVEASIRSVLDQTLQPVEVIVVDDGSTDRTAAVVEAVVDSRVRLVRQSNRGVSAARNAGLALARAPLVLFLDGDDLLVPDALGRMSAALQAQPDRVAVVAQHEKILEDGRPLSASPPPPKPLPQAETLRHLLGRNFIVTGGAICIVTAQARAVGGFNEKLRFGEDWEFWCRLALRADFAVLPEYTAVYYRIRASGANTRLRGTPRRPNFSAIDAVQSIPGLSERLTPGERRRTRRLAEFDNYWGSARNELVNRRFGMFLQYVLIGFWRYPDALLQPSLIRRFLWSSVRMSAVR